MRSGLILIIIGLTIVPLKLLANCIDLNTALLEDLEKLTGIGPTIGQKIIENRPYSSIDDLIKVPGIGEKKLAAIKEQGLACVLLTNQTTSQPTVLTQPSKTDSFKQDKPIVELIYDKNIPVNKEFSVTLIVSNLEKASYDVKMAIESNNQIISDVYNEKENKWQSSNYYLKESIFGATVEKNFKLKINEKSLNFQGEANLLVRLRKNGQSSYFEQRGKINILPPINPSQILTNNSSTIINIKQANSDKALAEIYQPASNLFKHHSSFLIALVIAFSSGLIILVLKKKLNNLTS